MTYTELDAEKPVRTVAEAVRWLSALPEDQEIDISVHLIDEE